MIDYTAIDSLAQIRPPYPAVFSADWWKLRQRVEQLIARDSRRRKTVFTAEQFRHSENARLVALGDEEARRAYERGGDDHR